MAGTLIGQTGWCRMTGDSESHGEDGSVTITRMYNGAITGGTAEGLGTSWVLFKAAHPPGTSDPDFGSAAISLAYPQAVETRGKTMTASITYKGGNFESPDGETTIPVIHKVKESRVLEESNVDAAGWVEITYQAWVTTISYTRRQAPNTLTTGLYSAKAEKTFVILGDEAAALRVNAPPILQKKVEHRNPMLPAELRAKFDNDFWMETMEITQRGNQDGDDIYDIVEVYVQGLKVR